MTTIASIHHPRITGYDLDGLAQSSINEATVGYPFVSNYIWVLLERRKIRDISFVNEITNQIQEWLSEVVRHDGKNNYAWSTDYLKTTIRNSDNTFISFATVLRFKFQEDLLAFQFKFDMFET
jgi:hypothetical protein